MIRGQTTAVVPARPGEILVLVRHEAGRHLGLWLLLALLAARPADAATPAEFLTSTNAPRSVNIALRANGGKLELASPPAEEKFNANLNDGYSTEWRARGKQLPQDIVLSFSRGGTAVLDRVVIDTVTKEIAEKPDHAPREVEIAVSLESPTAGFLPVASAVLERRAGRQMITFDPAQARYLRARFKSTYGQPVQLAEIEAYEAAGHRSVREGRGLNIAAAGNGGAVVRFTETSSDAAWLLDGQPRGWHTDAAVRRTEVVFAFRGDREALIERIVIDPRSQHPAATMARRGKIFLSSNTPIDGFEEAGEFQIEKDGREASVLLNRSARFVKLVITDHPAGKNISLGEVRIFEGEADGYRSIVSAPENQAATNAPAFAGEPEFEPNNSPDQAGVLSFSAPLRGQIKPLGDEDYFTFQIDQPKFPEVSLEVRGRPYVRTSLTLQRDGQEVAQFDPTNAAGANAIIKFPVTSGTYTLRVFEPPTSLLLVYDASSSMRESMTNLRVAVDAYVDQLRPSVLVNLIRFDSKHEVLLTNFTSDQAALKSAVAQHFAVGSGTAFFDAVNKGCTLLKNTHGNRAMIVMTDGADSASKSNYPAFWRLVEEHKIRLYTVGFGGEMDLLSDKLGTTPRRMMDHVAQATHGRSFMTESAEELKNLYEAIGDEIRQVSDYSLLAFWGEEPPKPGDYARRSGNSVAALFRRHWPIALISLLVGALIIGLIYLLRGKRSKEKHLQEHWSRK